MKYGTHLMLKRLIVILLWPVWISAAFSSSENLSCSQPYSRTVNSGGQKQTCSACFDNRKFRIVQRHTLGQIKVNRSLANIELYPIAFSNSGWGVDQVLEMFSMANAYLQSQQCELQLYAEDLIEIRVPNGYQVLEEPEQLELEKNFGFMPMMILADDLLRKSRFTEKHKEETNMVGLEEEQKISEQDFNFLEDTNGLGIIGMNYIYISNNMLVGDQKLACMPLLVIHEIMHAMLGYESEQHSPDYYNIFFSNCFSNVHTLENTTLDKQDCINLQHYAKSVATGQRKICKIK